MFVRRLSQAVYSEAGSEVLEGSRQVGGLFYSRKQAWGQGELRVDVQLWERRGKGLSF